MPLVQLLKSFKDHKAIDIFKAIDKHTDTDKIKEQYSRKIFYSRLCKPRKLKLIKKPKDTKEYYELTSKGLVVKHVLRLIEKSNELEWVLDAYDQTKEKKLIDIVLVGDDINEEIKKIITATK